MHASNHYDILNVSQTASQAEIKQAYRRLAKQFHPDRNQQAGTHETIARINAAYEVLGDPEARRSYDQEFQRRQRLTAAGFAVGRTATRQERQAAAQAQYRHHKRRSRQADQDLERWLQQIYAPVNRMLYRIISPLQDEVDELAADPFDDELMAAFQNYLDNCRQILLRAETTFRSAPNPATAARVAAHLYYCLNQVSDGIDQLETFTFNYDEDYLHTGQEMFRIATQLRCEAQDSARDIRI